MLDRSGGALLADEAGLGKTYVALAIARTARSPAVIAPAALRPMWEAAMGVTGIRVAFESYERLSRAPSLGCAGSSMRAGNCDTLRPRSYDLVVLDEAHHARNPATRRYGAIADLAIGASVLLLSATPVHNRRQDLAALLALFLGERAASMTDPELTHHVYRRERVSISLATRLPEAGTPEWLSLTSDDGLLEALVALPPPLPPADGGDGGALLVHGLVRQWASSDGALRGALDRRAARAGALVDALSAGRHPTRAELRSWTLGDGSIQLAFPELMASDAGADSAQLLHAVQEHAEAVNHLRRILRARPSLDAERGGLVRALRLRHRGEKVVAFTSYTDSAAALYRELRGDGGVAMLTASGGQVAGGSLTRRETIERFAPLAQGARPPRDAERIDILVATDLLSEGMNLQDASVVVHLDLPWTPARLEQRVGRAARLGSLHRRVAVYAFAPPASAERLIAVEQRLRQKLGVARAMVGGLQSVLPPLCPAPGTNREGEEPVDIVRQALARWRHQVARDDVENSAPVAIAAVCADKSGFLGAVETDDGAVLIAGLGETIGTHPDLVARAVRLAEGADCEVDPADLASARTAIAAWSANQRAASSAGAGASEPLRRRMLARIACIAQSAPAHRRSMVAQLAAAARSAVSAPMGAGAERRLAELAAATMPDEDWLAATAAFREGSGGRARNEAEQRIIGLLLFQRT